MSAGLIFIQDLAVVMLIAAAAAWLCQRAGLSVVVGYLVAGAIIGPFTPPFQLVADQPRVQTLADVGLVFLIFSIGMNLSISRLRRLGLSIVLATGIAALFILNSSRLIGLASGWSVTETLFIAGMLMVSSSSIIGKVLDELNATHERAGQLALGITVLEDVVAVIMLTLLTSLIQFGGNQAAPVLPTLAELGAYVVFLVILSLLLVPKLLARLSRNAAPEIRTIAVAGLLLIVSWWAARIGYSLALGAFVLGAVVGSTRFKADVERSFDGVRQIFGAVFFVAVGMQVDFKLLVSAWPLLVGLTALALLLRPLACTLGLLAVGNSTRLAAQAGLCLTPLGEFSFIIAQLGVLAGVVPQTYYPAAVGASLLTSLIAPFLTRRAESLGERVERAEPRVLGKWIRFYHDWLARLHHRQAASTLWRLTHRRLLQTGFYVLFVSALILIANPIYQAAVGALGHDWLFPNGLPVLFWSAFGVLLMAPLIALWRSVSTLSLVLAESATSGAQRQRRLRLVLAFALRTVAFLVLAVWLITLLPTGRSVLGAVGACVLLFTAVAIVSRHQLASLHGRLEIELIERFREASHSASTSAFSSAWLDPSETWQIELDEVTLPGDTAHAGHTVAELALRARHGCSIVGIDRQGFGIVNPHAATVLYPHDKLLLLGAREQLADAAGFLRAPADRSPERAGFSELTMETVSVPHGSPLVGRTLLELDLIRTLGVQVGGLQRGGERVLSPSGKDRLQGGDILLVLGTPQQIGEFVHRLSTRPPAVRRSDPALDDTAG